jgi:hypothetical protein
MSSIKKIERNRGLKESREQIKVLQDKWPAGFPKQASLVRPLANGAPKTIAEAFGWSVAYTRAVLMVWKSRAAYCTAVLAHSRRIISTARRATRKSTTRRGCWPKNALRCWPHGHHQPRKKPRRPLSSAGRQRVIRISCEYGTSRATARSATAARGGFTSTSFRHGEPRSTCSAAAALGSAPLWRRHRRRDTDPPNVGFHRGR